MSSNTISLRLDPNPVTCYRLRVNSKGDGFALFPDDKAPNEIQKEALKCKTNTQVLSFLQNNQIELYRCSFFHDYYKNKRSYHILLNLNWKDKNHAIGTYVHCAEKNYVHNVHPDTVEELVEFVKLRIFERENIYHRIFNKVEKAMKKTFECLNHYAKIPILGSIPASLKAVIGCLQLTVAVALLIIFAIPSIFSENAKAIFLRSEYHFFYGPINVISACFQAIPFCGLIFSKWPRISLNF